jgi:hypothetical protein
MLEHIVALGLITLGFAHGFITFPLFERVRRWIAKKISEKLVTCYFCVSFWISPLVVWLYYYSQIVLLPFGIATAAWAIYNIMSK